MGNRTLCKKCGFFYINGQQSEECPHYDEDYLEELKKPKRKNE